MSALTSLLARDQVVPVRKIEEALQKQVVSGGEMSSVLLELDALPENTLAAYCAALYGLLPATRDEVMRVARDTVRLVPREIAERHRIVPLAVDGRTLLVAMARPLDAEVEEQLGFLLGFDLVTRVVCDVRISAALVHHYGADAPPRHTRLVDKLRQREPGAVPYVAPPQDGKVDGGKLSALPAKRVSTADWLDADDDEDEDDERIPPASAITRTSHLPEGRPTDPMGFSRDAIDRAAATPAAPSEPAAIALPRREAPRRPSSLPPPRIVGGPAHGAATALAPASAPSPAPPEGDDADARPRSEPASETARALRRLRGPLTAAAGAKLLEQARERDEILEVFFAFARQFFDYAALFVVHDDVADGRDAFGSGAPVEAVRRIAIPLDVPSTFAEVRRTLAPYVGRLATGDLDRIVLRDLSRELHVSALVLPIAIRGRAVIVFYGDRAGDHFVLNDIPELVAFVPRVQAAFEALILRRKRGAGFRPAPERAVDAPERAAMKAAAKTLALSSPPPRASRSGWGSNGVGEGAPQGGTGAGSSAGAEPGAPAASMWDAAPSGRGAPEDGGAPPSAAHGASPSGTPPSGAHHDPSPSGAPHGASPSGADDDAPRSREPRGGPPPEGTPQVASLDGAPASEGSPRRRPRRPSSTSLEAAGVLAAEIASAPPAPLRKASAPAIDVAALARTATGAAIGEGRRGRTLQSMLGIPRDAPPPPDAQVTLPPVSERPPPRPATQPPAAREAEDHDEPELTFGSADSGEHEYDEDAEDEREGAAPSEPPVPLTRTRSEASRRSIPPQGGAYSVRDAAVDVVGRPRRTSVPPDAPERSRGAHASRPDPRAEDATDAPVTREVIHVPAIDARRSGDAGNAPGRLRPAPPSSEEMPSVIVDMGDHVNALVVDLARCGPDDEATIVEALVRTGEVALPTLAQAFPGPPWFDRRRPYRRLPRGRDVSAIARALLAFRERAVPYVESLLDAGHADRRFYATLVAGELVHPGLVAAMCDRIFDDDEGTRAAALELLPRFRIFPSEWGESIALVRRAAKIRGRDATKRHRAARALGAVRDAGALRLLVELLDDEDSELSEIAHRSLVEITCEDMGTAARRWTPWLQKNEKRHRVQWLIDALSHGDEAIRTSAGEELKTLTQQYYGYHPASPRKEREVVQQKYRRWWDEEGARLFAS